MAKKREYIKFKNGDCKMCGGGCAIMYDDKRTYVRSSATATEFTVYYDNKNTYPNYEGDDIRKYVQVKNFKVGDILYTLKNGAYCKVIAVEPYRETTYRYFNSILGSTPYSVVTEQLKASVDENSIAYKIKEYKLTLQFIDQYGNDVTSKLGHTSFVEYVGYLENEGSMDIRMYIYPNLSGGKTFTGSRTFSRKIIDPSKYLTRYYSRDANRNPYIFTPDGEALSRVGYGGGAWIYEFAKYTDTLQEKNEGEDTGGESTTGGQNGNFDDTSDNIDIPTLPVTNASSCGMVKMYEMSLAQTQALAGYLWSGATEFYDNLTKMFNDPMDSIISLSLAPIKPSVGGSTAIEICKYAIENVTGFPLKSQYASLNCGTVKIEPYWGNALDYAPYTKASIYLPFIGTQELNIDDVMNRTVGVTYNIDLLSGACACMITCDGSVMYNFSGNVISQIPVSGKNALEMYKSVISAVTNTALAVGTGTGGVALAGDVVSNGLSVMGSKMTVQRGGTISATNGVLGVKFPYITILRANQSLPADFHSFKGYPSNISGKVSSFSGYTEVEYVHVTGINATENELEMIEQILKEGFII